MQTEEKYLEEEFLLTLKGEERSKTGNPEDLVVVLVGRELVEKK